jgi:L-ascorbate metabolism protein UlaG (beta-lactamase superfamily)
MISIRERSIWGTIFVFIPLTCFSQAQFETDTLNTTSGDVIMTFIGHGTLMFSFNGLIVHVDPFGKMADYEKLPKADLILITHDHPDHFDRQAVELIRKKTTQIVLTKTCAKQIKDGIEMGNGDTKTICGIRIEAVPAYNIVHKREDGEPYHPRGAGNGYLLGFGDKKVYIAGDTENIPEMKKLGGVDVAFLPMNLPYTMTPEMVADAALMLHPKILYPYHYGDTDPQKLILLLKNQKEIEVRIRKLK